MKTLRVEGPEGDKIDLPVPTRVNRAARPIYKMMLVIVAAAAMGALVLDPSLWLWFGTILLVLPLPLHVYVEHKIKQSSWNDSKKYRGLLFSAEVIIPILPFPALGTVAFMMEAYGLTPTEGQLAVTIMGTMLAVVLTSILANRAWALGLLGLER
jgi:hypothetical protein